MKHVDKISIGRMAFNIEKDAHIALKEYIDSLELYYESNSARKEIISGIEERIAELLIEKGYKDKCVSLGVTNEIIDILGRPADFESQEEGSEYTNGNTGKIKKKLFRDPDNKIFGGVCGGFGVFCGVDPIIFRLFFAIWFLLSLFGPWWWIDDIFPYIAGAYILLWVIIPKAKTLEDRCAMYGEKISLSNIQTGIEQGFGTFKNEVKDIWYNERNTSKAGRIVSIVFASIFCMIGVFGLISVTISIFSTGVLGNILISELVNFDDFNQYILPMISSSTVVMILFWTTLSLVMTIPPIALIYLGVKVIFRIKSPSWRPGLILLIVWVLALIAFICVCIYCIAPLIQAEYYGVI